MGSYYTIRQGDYLSKIAHQHGFSDWKVIYNHPENKAFRKLRPEPNLIHPGDRLFIPHREEKQIDCATGQSHRFQVRLGANHLHVILKDARGQPLRSTAYELTVGHRVIRGKTDGDGALRHDDLPPDVTQATLSI